MKGCSPDVNFKILWAQHSCGLQAVLGWSQATPTAAAKQCNLKLPRAHGCEKSSLLHKIKQNASSSLQFHGLPRGTEKEFYFSPPVLDAPAMLSQGQFGGRSGKFSAMLWTHCLVVDLIFNLTAYSCSFWAVGERHLPCTSWG